MDPAGSGVDGLTWATAYTDLNVALGVATGGDEIRVGEGVYAHGGIGDTFDVPPGVSVLGGYAGTGSANPDLRDAAVYEVVLDGVFGPAANDRALHVVTFENPNGNLLEGVTIQNGLTRSIPGGPNIPYGAGILVRATGGSVSLVVRDCRVRDCENKLAGGGAGLGMGDLPVSATITIEDSSFVNCIAMVGGAVRFSANAWATVENCVFRANLANGADPFGGGAIAHVGVAGALTIDKCRFECNETDAGAGSGGAVAARWVPVTIHRSDFLRNLTLGADASGGALFTDESQVNVDRCNFISNWAGASGGALLIADADPNSLISNCLINGNTAFGAKADADSGGGIFIDNEVVTIANCTIVQNEIYGSTSVAGGVRTMGPVVNSIVWFNVSSGAWDDLFFDVFASPQIPTVLSHSCISGGLPDGWLADPEGTIAVLPKFIDLDGIDDTSGNADDNLRLSSILYGLAISPCVDTADNDAIAGYPTNEDLPGADRKDDDDPKVVDMGAYEVTRQNGGCPGDENGDLQINFTDLNAVLDAWGTTISPRGGLGDADGDGDVDFDDLNLVNEHWGEVCHPVAPNCSPFSEQQMASGSSAAANETVPAYIAALGIVSVADYRSRLDAVDSEADRLSLNLELLTSYWSYGQ